MTNAQHTPGQWDLHMVHTQNGDNHLTYRIEADGDHPRRIADLLRPDLSPNGHIAYDAAVEEANARLIAAAPELLEALKWTESWIVKHGLDKAELITGQWAEVPILGTIRAAIAKATSK